MSAPLFDFDPEKEDANVRKHGLSLDVARLIDWSAVTVVPDERKDYRETRYQIYGKVMGRLHVLIATPRRGSLRIISLRKANRREVRRYG